MKKGVLIVVIIFFISVVIVSSGEDKVDNVIEEKLLSQEKVKVIVVLKDSGIKSVSKRGVSVKQQILQNLDEKEFEKKREFNIINGFSGEVTKEGLEKLKSNENVEKIYYDYPIKAFLQDSVNVVNASKSWPIQLFGVNITGKDETICIIDTGIDFTHPDLIGKNETCIIDCYNKDCIENCSIGDDNGHGTHVAGIVAANGGIRGVAPDVDLIGIKSLDSTGSGSDNDVERGIEWCVNNVDLYNISVISMSLGTECYYSNGSWIGWCYDNYCDSETSTTLFINYAISKNISVIVASGNDGNTSYISSPACVQNATSVGATDKNDAIASYSNRGGILDLLAPGGISENKINSTKNGGGYIGQYGTSMATPHVAGAFALIKQFLRLQDNRISTPQEIQDVLAETGALIDDSTGSGLNFSRVDIYSAIFSLDNAPVINITLSSDVLEYNQQNLTLNIIYSDSDLTFYNNNISYPSGTLLAEFSNDLVLTTENLTELGTYTITAWASDIFGKETTTSITFLVQDTGGLTSGSFILNYPDDNNITGNELIFFNITIGSKYNLTNITLYHNYIDWGANETLDLDINETSVEFNSSFSDGRYLWGAKACDVNNYCAYSNNRTLIVDNTDPVVNLYSPINSSSVTALPIDFTFNVSDYGIDNCVLILSDTINETLTFVSLVNNNVFIENIYYLPNGNYNWSVNCSDKVARSAVSDTWDFTLNCASNWSRSCEAWSDCSGGYKYRLCYDANYCTSNSYNQSSTNDCSSSGDGTTSGGETIGGGAATTTTETESVLIFSGLANDIKSFGISKDVGIDGVTLTLKNAVTNAKLSVKKLDSNPTSVSLDNVYKYIQIDKGGITDDDIKEAVIKFKVEKNWINTNAAGVNYVFMQRYNNGKWEKLETLTAGSDDNYQKYQANTVGFSYFAINAEKALTLPTLNTLQEGSSEEEIVTSSNVSNKTGKFDFRSLFSGSVVKDLGNKIKNINVKNLFGKSSVYNILFVVIIFLMLVGVSYKYREVILSGIKKPKKGTKFKEKDLGVKKKFFIFKDRVKNIEKKEVDLIFNKLKVFEENTDEKLKAVKEERVAKMKIKEQEMVAKSNIKEAENAAKKMADEAERAARLKAKEEKKMAEENAKKAKLERFEVKDKGDEKWEDFDMESDWDEGD